MMGGAWDSFKELSSTLAGWVEDRLPTLSLLIALLFLPNYTVFELESKFYDVYTKIRALRYMERSIPVEPDVIVVLVDDEAIRQDSQFLSHSPHPLPRRYLANLLSRICESKPTGVALDVLLDFATSKEEDDLLATVLGHAYARRCPVVLPSKLSRSGGWLYPVLPIPDFLSTDAVRQGQLLIGHINVESSTIDLVVRRVRAGQALKVGIHGNTYVVHRESDIEFDYLSTHGLYSLSLPMQMLRLKHLELQGNSNRDVERLLKNAPFLIDFASVLGRVSILSSSEVMAGKRREQLKDKMIILGVAYSESADWHMTPLSTTSLFVQGFKAMGPIREPYPGSELLAYMYVTLDRVYTEVGRIKEIGQWKLTIIAIVAFGIIQIGSLLVGKPHLAGRLIFILLCSYWIVSVVAYQSSGLYLAVLRPNAAIIALSLLVRYLKKLAKSKG